MSNRSARTKRAIAESIISLAARSLPPPPVVPVCHTPPDRPFLIKRDVRTLGGHRKVKKQGNGHASNDLFHPLIKPRLDARKSYRELEAMINPSPKFKMVGPFKVEV